MSKLYVGNLSWNTTTGVARVVSVLSPTASSQEADAAIQAMNETEFEGRRIRVNIAGERGGGGGGGGYGGGGGGGYGGGGGGGYGGGGGGYDNSGSGGGSMW
ncbi:putative glycine-rich RNA-binding protein [Mycena rebaudengoi]|nr:putative glycine-rich RNA-binding protein [Mycena rebaudengoi]